jgi:vacuolar-type H+-ATPase subunit C/Vma6
VDRIEHGGLARTIVSNKAIELATELHIGPGNVLEIDERKLLEMHGLTWLGECKESLFEAENMRASAQ